MSVFVDTSALYALLVETSPAHAAVADCFSTLLGNGEDLVTSNYVLLETTALLQNRVGMAAVRDLNRRIVPVLRVSWLREEDHRKALDRLIRTDRRGLSPVDCASFSIMETEGIRRAFALDDDFAREGFQVLPAPTKTLAKRRS